MAEVIWGLATSHVPSIGAAMDRGKTDDPNWKALFDGYAPARAWLAEHRRTSRSSSTTTTPTASTSTSSRPSGWVRRSGTRWPTRVSAADRCPT